MKKERPKFFTKDNYKLIEMIYESAAKLKSGEAVDVEFLVSAIGDLKRNFMKFYSLYCGHWVDDPKQKMFFPEMGPAQIWIGPRARKKRKFTKEQMKFLIKK